MEHNETRTAVLETLRGLEIMTVLADAGTGGAESERAINACCEGGTRQISRASNCREVMRSVILCWEPSHSATLVVLRDIVGSDANGPAVQ